MTLVDEYDAYDFLDIVEATFCPLRTDDLRPDVIEWVGWRCKWQHIGYLDDEEEEAMWQPYPPVGELLPFRRWVPWCDLADVVPVDVAGFTEDDA